MSGTTLADDEHDGSSCVERLRTIPESIHADAFVCQLSTNDASKGKRLGLVQEDGPFDTSTVSGAIQYVVDYARRTWGCPVAFYTGTYFDSDEYAAMVEVLGEVSALMGVPVIDLYNDEGMRSDAADEYARYLYDPVHPTKAGYGLWWMPKFESGLVLMLNAAK